MVKGKQMATYCKEKAKIEPVAELEEEVHEADDDGDDKKKRIALSGGSKRGSGNSMRNCQVEKCTADLSEAKQYHRRHKVCEHHAKAAAVVIAGVRQRFCQQCSRFHELSEFDEAKRSCRRRLAGHNERRRKNSAESNIEDTPGRIPGSTSGAELKELVCGQVNERGGNRIPITIQGNANYKHFQIR